MNEERILNETLKILNKGEVLKAYEYILNNKEKINVLSSQAYNFLYCLGSLSGKREEALKFFKRSNI
ncbi:hypothetical protein [Miniphocaeibacter massiliensis]|uniref:hypothetical protein n=1 Tax=Miniphocaeibacter massiliensis TaxID=2041841 RepID=UPI000C1B940A|nr:hypothetical protein [Miniphocaeibacter massiliensis]